MTANKRGRGRVHWAVIRREDKRFHLAVLLQVGHGPWFRYGRQAIAPGRKMTLTIRVGRKKLQDPDNFLASLKGVIDAIKRAGWIVDDSAQWLNLIGREKASRSEYTEVLLEESR